MIQKHRQGLLVPFLLLPLLALAGCGGADVTRSAIVATPTPFPFPTPTGIVPTPLTVPLTPPYRNKALPLALPMSHTSSFPALAFLLLLVSYLI